MQLPDVFNIRKPVIGMLHVPALPGSPQNKLDFNAIIDWVLRDAEALAGGGADGLMIENFGDVPFYPRRVPPHTVAFMTALGRELRRRFDVPLGVNVLRNDSASALAIAAAVNAAFIRVNIHTGARLTDQGLIQGTAHQTLRYRKLLGCDVKIFADVDVKHSAPLASRELRDEVEEVVSRCCADAIIVTGSASGRQTALEDLKRGLGGLATIGSVAPFVGLFGTTIGIINAFQGMRIKNVVGIEAVAGGIAEALVTTAFGLFVAVPAVMAFNAFSNRIETLTVEMDNSASELLDYFIERRKIIPR